MTTSSSVRQVGVAKRWVVAIIAIALLSLLYLLQITIVRGPQGTRQSLELFSRAIVEWGSWFILAPFILRFADMFPVGPDRPSRNLLILGAGGLVALPLWAMLVGLPLSGFGITLWGSREPSGYVRTVEAALVQRGPYLLIIYGFIVGLATTRRLAHERQDIATRTVELRRELAAAELAEFSQVIGPERLVERLHEIERTVARSADDAEEMTLALSDELHTALVQSRNKLRS